MFAFAVKRILQAMIVMLIISCIGFAIKHNFGDPVRDLVGQRVTPAERAEIREQLGLNDPFLVQYVRFLGAAAKGDLGLSYFFKKPATEVILKKAPATLELVFCAALIITLLSVPLGIYAAIKPKSLLSRIVMGVSTVGVSMPVFLTAILLIYIFSVELKWLPSFGRGETVLLFGWWESGLVTWDGLQHLIMPSVALSSIMLPLFIRLIRSEMMEVLESEYVKYAWAKGLRPRRIWWVHAFKNTLLPVITVGGVQLGIMVAFTILTETVFQWQGMGSMFIESVERSDTSLMVAYLVFVGFVFVLVNTAVDIIYGLVNPMVRVAGRK
ncbi:MAG: ABC transporter permease [Pseudodesulfovibrio sp.]|uniref:Binding-protein-dependent transport systems inner membrane component n=3 Tax=Pseudodesulfovibrio aespoeensis TaxID=182210 RepID=E6VRM2_PSEA9|nr:MULTISPECIES: ABC transporter permease [Pseudodesulfovibrio]MBU4380568.1 ABC transporter permease [Pseudomonadota bacterium]ADU63059.1 binding-protein-dependent transport systems inner membrane component [Pseudodesulfovibrio aespoeensis Aspo-2]MBU4516673.1 ABC transporter permease [Pseudomonadota bacterium]MBU4522630.1 ABC transporter permease [Pseudomonadota bacterium]MBU4558778.1 ABC transporter permease [Pseudomonadota bacterium]